MYDNTIENGQEIGVYDRLIHNVKQKCGVSMISDANGMLKYQ